MPQAWRLPSLFIGLAVLAVSVSLVLSWGFTVDDALISTRVAHHLATGIGYRFNASGPIQDAVTPLGWAVLLAPLATQSVWEGLVNSRILGVVLSVFAAALLGMRLQGKATAKRLSVLIPVGVCLPLGAWSVSGMETPLIVLLTTVALLRPRLALLGAGAAAALRPELTPWALVLATFRPAANKRERLLALATTLALPALVCLIRLWVFGHPAPLAVFAKPSDATHGVSYVLGGLRLLGLPLLWVSVASWPRVDGHIKAVALACGAHCMALFAAGGDWMALFRLFVPIIPALVLVAAELAATSEWWAIGVRTALATLVCSWLLLSKGDAARGVWEQRRHLIAEAKPLLESARNVGTLDVGWVGAATSRTVTDFAGVTDRLVALRPGGHTSKQLSRDFLERRSIDALVLLLAPGELPSYFDPTEPGARNWRQARFSRGVEFRVAHMAGAERFTPVGGLRLRGTEQYYLVLRKLRQRFASHLALSKAAQL